MAYVRIQLNEMKQVLTAEKGWKETDLHAGEYVYEFELAKTFPGTVVKVYTSIRKQTDLGRRVGDDAIRVSAVHLPSKKGIAKAARIYRTAGWQDRLRGRIISVIRTAQGRKWMIQ